AASARSRPGRQASRAELPRPVSPSDAEADDTISGYIPFLDSSFLFRIWRQGRSGVNQFQSIGLSFRLNHQPRESLEYSPGNLSCLFVFRFETTTWRFALRLFEIIPV